MRKLLAILCLCAGSASALESNPSTTVGVTSFAALSEIKSEISEIFSDLQRYDSPIVWDGTKNNTSSYNDFITLATEVLNNGSNVSQYADTFATELSKDLFGNPGAPTELDMDFNHKGLAGNLLDSIIDEVMIANSYIEYLSYRDHKIEATEEFYEYFNEKGLAFNNSVSTLKNLGTISNTVNQTEIHNLNYNNTNVFIEGITAYSSIDNYLNNTSFADAVPYHNQHVILEGVPYNLLNNGTLQIYSQDYQDGGDLTYNEAEDNFTLKFTVGSAKGYEETFETAQEAINIFL